MAKMHMIHTSRLQAITYNQKNVFQVLVLQDNTETYLCYLNLFT